MANEKKKTSYSQTIKGNKATANSHKRQADLLARLAQARREGMKNLSGQYWNARSRNKATRDSVIGDLLGGFRTAQEGYDRSNKDAEANLGTTASGSVLNRAREGANAMSELSNMQAGESDRIKGMAASLRGLQANLQGGTSDYASAMTSINNSLGDLNTSVTTNINNALREQNTQNAQAYAELMAGKQQGYSDLVDLYGQIGAEYEQVADAKATKNSTTNSVGTEHIKSTQTDKTYYGKGGNQAIRTAQSAFDKAASAADSLASLQGKFFDEDIMTLDQYNQRTSDPNMRFTAAAMKENRSNLDDLSNAGTLRKLAAPEGSTLRKISA